MGYTLTYTELLKTGAVTTAAETTLGDDIKVKSGEQITVWVKYSAGDETKNTIKVYFKHTSGGDEFQEQAWTAASGNKTVAENAYDMSATINTYISFNIETIGFMKITEQATGGTPTGTTEVYYTLTEA